MIPKGSTVDIMPLILGYKSGVFEKPFEFRPERWIEASKVPPPYTFIPFSAGERTCIGQYLAKIETKMILQKFI